MNTAINTGDQEEQPPLLLAIDYTALPVEAEVTLFQRLVRDLVQAILEQRQPLPTLSLLLTSNELAAHRPPLLLRSKLDRYRLYGSRDLVDDLGLNLSESIRHWRKRRRSRSRAVLRRLPPRIHLSTLLNRLEQRLSPIAAPNLPDELLVLMVERGWRDLAFQREIADLLHHHLRQTVLMTEEDKVLALFSPNTFWILIALTPPPAALGSAQFRWSYWVERWTISRLQRLATQRVSDTAEWAGFWDQWLIWHVLTQHPAAADQLSSILYNALLALPIFALCRPASMPLAVNADAVGSQASPPTDAVNHVKNTQHDDAGRSHDGRQTQPSPNRPSLRNRFYRAGQLTQPPVAALTFAIADWQAAVPGWFYAYHVNKKL